MDSRLLEYFLRVAELGSINKAAADLHLSQPALSRHVAALEHEMGTQLFTRTQGGVHLTESGKLLSDRARPLLRQFSILKEQVGEKAAGQLAIGIPPSWQHVFTSRFATQMLEQHPSVTMRVYEGVSHVLRDHLFAGLLDLCILPFETAQAPGFRQTALVREPMVLVGEGLDPGNPAPVSALDGLRLVLPPRPNVLRGNIEHALTRKGLSFKVVMETDTLALCLEMARNGVGYTAVPACSLHHIASDRHITWTPVRGMMLTWALYENQARAHSQAVREGRRLVVSTVAERIAQGDWFGAEHMRGAPRGE